MLELLDVELPQETEKEKAKEKWSVEKHKETLNIYGYFRHITNNAWKGKRLDLRSK